MESSHTLLTLLQISDSCFPTGGFSHSLGLEAALKTGIIKNKESLKTFLQCCLENAGSFNLPFMREAYENCTDVKRLNNLDTLCDACTPNHVAKRASARQGVSMLDTSTRVFRDTRLVTYQSDLPYKHQPVVYGLICGLLGVEIEAAMTAFLFSAIRTAIASAVRLDRVGPIEAQAIQLDIQKSITAVIKKNRDRQSDAACMLYPTIDIIQNTHDRMFTKLFFS